jgi:iron complex outermembrane receptor protein
MVGVVQSQQRTEGSQPFDQSLDSLLNLKVQTASKYWQKASESPTSLTVVTAADIENQGYRTLDEVLNAVRSFYVSYDRNYVNAGIRGFSRPTDYNDRILLLLNGHTVNESFYGSASFGTDFGIDLHSVDRIEIVRGPGSALYGSGAMFAIVNVITKKGNVVDGARVEGGVGSYGRREVSALIGKELSNGLDFMVSSNWRDVKGQDLYFKEFDTDSTNHGLARNLDWDKEWSFVTSVDYGDFSFLGSYVNRRKGIPTASFGTRFNDPDSWTIDNTGLLEFKYQKDLNAVTGIMMRGYFDSYHYEGAYPYEVQTHDGTDVRKVGSELQLRWDSSPVNRLVAGMELYRAYRSTYVNRSATEVYFDGDFPFSSVSGYVQDEWQIANAIALVTGIRLDSYSHISPSISPRIAAIVHPWNSGTVKVLFGQAFRAPNNYELYFEDQLAYKNNPGLQSEKITTSEIVWDQEINGSLLTTVSVYNNVLTGLIDQQLDPADSLYQFRNVSQVRAVGIETELRARLKGGFALDVSASYGRAKDALSDATLTNSPNYVVKSTLSIPLLKMLRIGSNMRYESSRETVYATETDPYFLMGLFLSSRLDFLANDPGLVPAITLRIDNVFNRSYQLPGGYEHRQASIPQDGRNFLIGLSFTF